METLWRDLRFGCRMLRKTPGFTAVAVLTLALGIGANTAIFSTVNAALLRPLPFPHPDRLMMLFHSYPKLNLPRATVSPIGFDYYLKNARSFEKLAAFTNYRVPQNLTGSGNPERVRAVGVTSGFFPALGVNALRGRTIGREGDQVGSRVAVLSYALWQQRFAGDVGVVGRDITLDGNNYTVIGIMPHSFDYPHGVQLWLPLPITPEVLKSPGAFTEYLAVLGRLKPDISFEQVRSEMTRITGDVLKLYPELAATGWHVTVVPSWEVEVGNIRMPLLVLLGAVGCVLLIACANVANLLLARSAGRQKEIAIRVAMGASRSRVVRQLLTEGVLLAVIGGGIGLLLGYWGIDLLVRLLPPSQALTQFAVTIDRNVLLFTLGVSVVTGLLFASAPAIQSARTALITTLKEGGRTSTVSGHHRFRAALVISEMALALVLLVGAGLMIRSFLRLQSSDPGFDPQHVVTMRVALPQPKYKDETRQAQFFDELAQRVSALPGVQAAGVTSMLPLDQNWTNSFRIEGRNLAPAPHGHIATASPQYFAAMQIPLLRGRTFTDGDASGAPRVVVIDDALMRAYWPDGDAIGKHISISLPGETKPVWREIVGIVEQVKHADPLAKETKGQAYIPSRQLPMAVMNLAVRATGDPTALVGAIRNQVSQLDPEQPIADIRTMAQALDQYVAEPRFNTLLLACFAALAMVLAAVGIYGVIACSVAQRTHEIGVRMALGARTDDVLRLVLSQAVRLATVGLLIGIVGSLLATRVLVSMLYGVKSTDPLTFIVISLVLAAVAIAASYIPARRATRVDPMVALRYE